MSKRTDRGLVMKQLGEVQRRAAKGILTNEDMQIIANTLIRLTKLVYEPLIQEEEGKQQ
jgi:hypothetical protein